MTENESDSDEIPELEDVSDGDGVEHPIKCEVLVARCALSTQSRSMIWSSRIYSILDAILTIMYVV